MSICPNNTKAEILWQYGEKPPNRIVGIDDYTIEQKKGQCDTQYAYWINYDFYSYGVRYSRRVYLFTLQGRILDIQTSFNKNNSRHYAFATIFTSSFPDGYGGGAQLNRGWDLIEDSIFVDFSRADGLPDDCGECVFTVYKTAQIIHQETQPNCPTVTVDCLDGYQCPPNTCEVKCGNHLCCYDQNGNVVKTIYK